MQQPQAHRSKRQQKPCNNYSGLHLVARGIALPTDYFGSLLVINDFIVFWQFLSHGADSVAQNAAHFNTTVLPSHEKSDKISPQQLAASSSEI